MKNRFTSNDLRAMVEELRPRLLGMRAANIYDVDKKTYLIKFAKPPNKAMLLIESGIRFHSTQYDWPAQNPPAAFAMKCRKHIRTKRLSGLEQIGTDRVVCFTFGANETAYHLIIELYDKGNILLCDAAYVILSLLRPRSEADTNVRFAVHERYPIELAQKASPLSIEAVRARFVDAKRDDPLRKYLNPMLPCGPSVIEHALLSNGFPPNAKVGNGFDPEEDMDRCFKAVQMAETLLDSCAGQTKGYIILKTSKSRKNDGSGGATKLVSESDQTPKPTFFDEFHPILFKQHESTEHQEFDTFDAAVDTFFSEMEAQKIELRTLAKENAALKKLENVKNDHERRLKGLKESQEQNARRAELIELNIPTVEKAIQVVNSALASSMEWSAIGDMVAEATARGDAVAATITSLKLEKNMITMKLSEPYDESSASNSDTDSDSDGEYGAKRAQEDNRSFKKRSLNVDIDLSQTAYANARAHYESKRSSAIKETKTIEASAQALKNAEKKTAAALKHVQVSAKMQRSRKVYWFEKFLWFISSENYLIIGGRDRQQNEQIVRRYLTKGDVYVHADFHGAPSCVIKNPRGGEIPPKTLSEAGAMASSFSSAWDAKIVTGAYWVYHDQVSKTAPTGEYLTTGAFMIRGKKNFLQPSPLIVGYGLLFKIDESCIVNHLGERNRRHGGGADSDSSCTTQPDRLAENSTTSDTPDKDVVGNAVSTLCKSDIGEAQHKSTVMVESEDAACGDAQSSLTQSTSDSNDETTFDGVKDKSQSTGSSRVAAPVIEHDSPNGVEITDELAKDADAVENSDDSEDIYPDTAIRFTSSGSTVGTSRETSGATSDVSENKGDFRGKAGVARSAKQKRDARKQRSRTLQNMSASGGDTLNDNLASEKNRPPKQKQASGGKGAGPAAVTHSKRGKKGKLAKMKMKYADQDDDERELAMAILASGNSIHKLSKKEKRKQRREDGQKGSRQVRGIGGQGLELPPEALERMGEGMITKPLEPREDWSESQAEAAQREKDARIRETAREEEEDEIRKILEAENVQVLDDSMKEGITYLDTLTGSPRSDDVLSYAVPVVAPMSALLSYKYRVKMIPGSMKKGKAATSIMHGFMTLKDCNPQEKDLMKCIKDSELFGNLPGKVKVMGGRGR